MNTELDLGMAMEQCVVGREEEGGEGVQKCLLKSHGCITSHEPNSRLTIARALTPDVVIFANEFERILSLLQQNSFCTHV